MTREEYKKKIAFCDKLGARRFQKIVLKVEELKFRVIKKSFPNFIQHYDSYVDRRRAKNLKKAKTQEEQEKIINDCRNLKIAIRRELNREQNRNYHIDQNKPTEFLYYLEWNKKVHKKGLIKNGIAILLSTGAIALDIFPVLSSIILGYELFDIFINFQCVNIQNSHIYRFKLLEPTLKKKEENRDKKNVKNYSQAANVYGRAIQNTMDIPTVEQLVANVQTKEEIAQLRKMIQLVKNANARIKVNQPKPEVSENVQSPQVNAQPQLRERKNVDNSDEKANPVQNSHVALEDLLNSQLKKDSSQIKITEFQKVKTS